MNDLQAQTAVQYTYDGLRITYMVGPSKPICDALIQAHPADTERAYKKAVKRLHRFATKNGMIDIELELMLGTLEAIQTIKIEARQNQADPLPPLSLELILRLITPFEKQNDIVVPMADAYSDWVEKYDERWAKVLYCKEICRSFASVSERAVAWFVKYKIAHYLGEIISRFTLH